MQDSAQEAAMRHAEQPDPVAVAQAKVEKAIRAILKTDQQHGVITVTLRRDGRQDGRVSVEVIATTTTRY